MQNMLLSCIPVPPVRQWVVALIQCLRKWMKPTLHILFTSQSFQGNSQSFWDLLYGLRAQGNMRGVFSHLWVESDPGGCFAGWGQDTCFSLVEELT